MIACVSGLVVLTVSCDEESATEEEERIADPEEEQPDELAVDDDAKESPYFHDELEGAVENLDSPEPGTAVLVFEGDREHQIDAVECDIDEDDPTRGKIHNVGEFEDGREFRATIRRTGSDDSLENEFTLYVETPEGEEIDRATFTRTRDNFPIQPEEGADGRPAFVIKDDDTWYGGAPLEPVNKDAEPFDEDYGDAWIAATCE